MNPITEGNKLAVDTKVNFKSSIQDVVNLVNSYVTLYNNSKNFVVSNSTLISNEKKNQSSSNNSQKISKVCFGILVITLQFIIMICIKNISFLNNFIVP